MKRLVHYEVVTVCNRLEDGRLREWYTGDKFATLREANAEAVSRRKNTPENEHAVIRVTVDELPRPVRGKTLTMAAH